MTIHARIAPMSDRDQIAALVRLVASLSARVTALESPALPRPKAMPVSTEKWRMAQQTILDLVKLIAIQEGIAERFILCDSRERHLSHARQWVMFEAHLRGISAPMIGRALRKDHSTVLHGITAERERRLDKGLSDGAN